MKRWYDVHFSLNGFMKIETEDDDDAAQIAEELLNEPQATVERMLGVGIGIEIADVLD